MDQGDATVWAAGLGIAGTLAAGLIGPLAQSRAARRQVREQEAVDVRHRLRDERREAFAAVLDQCEVVRENLGAIITAQVAPDWRPDADHRELWRPANASLDALRRAAMNVSITGPARMGELAHAMHEAVMTQANSLRMLHLSVNERAALFGPASSELEQTRQEFIDEAQRAMAPPD